MSSMIRNLQRKFLRQQPGYKGRKQFTILHEDGGYTTLTPTKGWRFISGKRLDAQRRMARLLGA